LLSSGSKLVQILANTMGTMCTMTLEVLSFKAATQHKGGEGRLQHSERVQLGLLGIQLISGGKSRKLPHNLTDSGGVLLALCHCAGKTLRMCGYGHINI
jgi:hypothetical protein